MMAMMEVMMFVSLTTVVGRYVHDHPHFQECGYRIVSVLVHIQMIYYGYDA
jgi:hypothetical protein